MGRFILKGAFVYATGLLGTSKMMDFWLSDLLMAAQIYKAIL